MDNLADWLGKNWIALVALLLSLWALLRQHLANREAKVTAWFAKTPEGASANRLILANNGPAEARDIDIRFEFLMSGQPWKPTTTTGDPLPLPLLAAGDQFHLPCFVTVGEEYVKVFMTWKDKRRGTQSRQTTLSLTGVPLGDSGGRVVVQKALDDIVRHLRSM